jgi:hypothetical protein
MVSIKVIGMKKYLLYFILGAAATGAVSCKDYLNEVPKYALTDANAITNVTKARAAVGGVYATFQGDDWAGSMMFSYSSRAGFVKWLANDYSTSHTQANTNTARWTAFYKSLNAANFAVNGTDKLPASAISETEKAQITAEARLLRAWIHMNIFWSFGYWWADDANPNGILYRDQVIDLTNIEKGRISVGESYAKIFEDIDYAIANLGNYTDSKTVSKQFAQALKAKILLYRGGYRNNTAELNEALTLVNAVLATPGALRMEADLEEVYNKAWDSKEVLFARYLEDDGTRTTKGGYYYTYYLSQIAGTALPLGVNATLTAGLNYGLDWFITNPRWDVVTGPVRAGETWDNTYRHTFKKVARLGSYAGKLASPPDEKYAVYYFRMPELYLMKAELLARTGANLATALAPLNEMRAQRTNPVLPALNPANMDELMDMLFQEIFLENFGENGSEYFASLRFMKNGKRYVEVIKPDVDFEEFRICLPIPDSEIVNNKAMTQNPDLN